MRIFDDFNRCPVRVFKSFQVLDNHLWQFSPNLPLDKIKDSPKHLTTENLETPKIHE